MKWLDKYSGNIPKAQNGGTWEKQQASVKAEKITKLKNLLKNSDQFLKKLEDNKEPIPIKEQVPTKKQDNVKVVIKNKPELTSKAARNKTDKEIAEEREAKIQESIKYQDVPYTSENWREVLAKTTQATGDKFRVSNEPNFFDDYLNPAAMIGSMASNLGQAPQQAQQSDSYLPYVTAFGTPLAVGAVGGIGAKNTGQFVNNLANPLAGTGDLVNNLGNKYLPNAYKLNPFAEKLKNADSSYRVVGLDAYEDFIKTGGVRSVTPEIPQEFAQLSLLERLQHTPRPTSFPSFQKGFADLGYLPKEGGVVFKTDVPTFKRGEINPVTGKKITGRHYAHRAIDTETGVTIGNLPASDVKVFSGKPDWLKGYKEIEAPKSSFKSEVDWGKWNKEIPDNSQLMKEYNAIEQQAKANGTWMKNPDGSAFNGTPEQFVQQNSSNFKKAFGNSKLVDKSGSPTKLYHGTPQGEFSEIDLEKIGFTDKGVLGKTFYTTPKKSYAEGYMSPRKGANSPKLYELYGDVRNPFSADDAKSMDELFNFNRNSAATNDAIFRPRYVKDTDIRDINNSLEIGITNPATQLKSAVGNNGMFDMTNPNIYKSVLPIGLGLGAASQLEQKKNGGIIKDDNGYWNPKNWGKTVEINSPDITMEGVNQPLLGTSKQTGEKRIMFPGENHKFANTKQVIETPLKGKWLNKYN